jgi:hypothetical protein
MIQMPRRSVTRFFIPLIDVLTLLFCIFLLMPLVKAPGEEADGSGTTRDEEVERLRQEVKRLQEERDATPAKLHEELDRLRQEKIEALQQRLAVRVLEIDAATGQLAYNDPERAEVRTEADARALVERDRRATAGGSRELYYLILYPRDPNSPYPLGKQRARYDAWFKDLVAHGWDIPGASLKGGTP